MSDVSFFDEAVAEIDLPSGLVKPPENISKIIYFGTPDAAVPQLRALSEAGFDIVLVVTKPDVRRGRGKKLTPSPVKQEALRLGLPVAYHPDEALEVTADLGVVISYGQILRANLLSALPLVNVHFSLLPRWRGAAPIERSLLAGDTETGICLMEIDHELDTGRIYKVEKTPIQPSETSEELRSRLVALSSEMLVKSLREGLGEPKEQRRRSDLCCENR